MLQFLHLARVFDMVVLKESQRSFLMLVLDLFGSTLEILLFPLSLASFEIQEGYNVALSLESTLFNGAFVQELGGAN